MWAARGGYMWQCEPVWDSRTQGGVGLSSVSGLLGLRQRGVGGGGGGLGGGGCPPTVLVYPAGKRQNNLGDKEPVEGGGRGPLGTAASSHFTHPFTAPHGNWLPHSSQMRNPRPREARDRAFVSSRDPNSTPESTAHASPHSISSG